MKYSTTLRKLFPNIKLIAEDLLFLESYQIKNLPSRVPKKEFSTLLRKYPVIHRFLVIKHPPISVFINKVLSEHEDIVKLNSIEYHCQELLWEIADLIVYNKYPEIYDKNVPFNWEIDEIISVKWLEGKTIIDAGAGSGKFAFLAAQFAQTVFAVEPATGFRQFIRQKAANNKIKNIFVLDGFLDTIPLPENAADLLVTSNAVGWNLAGELLEIERVLKPNALAIHLLRNTDSNAENPFHETLISTKWNYTISRKQDSKWLKFKYQKSIVK